MNFTEVETFNNATILKDGSGKFGVKGRSLIEVYPKWDEYSLVPNDKNGRYLVVKQDGKFGVYDTVRLDYISYCTLTAITRYAPNLKTLYGKEPLKLFGLITRWNCTVDIPLYEN